MPYSDRKQPLKDFPQPSVFWRIKSFLPRL